MQYRTQIYLTPQEEKSFYNLLDNFLAMYPEKKCQDMIYKIRGWNNPTYCPHCHQTTQWKLMKNELKPRYYCNNCRQKYSLKTDTILHNTRTTLSTWLLFINLLIHYKNPTAFSKKLIEKHRKVTLCTSKKIINTLLDAEILKYNDVETFLKHLISIPVQRGLKHINVLNSKGYNSHELRTFSRKNVVYQYDKDTYYDLKLKIWGWLTIKPAIIISMDGLAKELGISATTINRAITEMEGEKVLYKTFVTTKTLPITLSDYYNLYQDLKDISGKGTMLTRTAQVYKPSIYKTNSTLAKN